MAGVRRKRTNKKKRINSTIAGRKLKKKKTKVHIESKAILKTWNKSKTVKENFKNIGLSYDPNSTLPVTRKKGDGNDELMEIDKAPKNPFIEELEAEASNGPQKVKHISPGEAQFLWALIKDHGDDYEAMMRDKRNYNQDTACQLKKKCTRFLNSGQDFSSYLNEMNKK